MEKLKGMKRIFDGLNDQQKADLKDALELFIVWHHPIFEDKSEQKERMGELMSALTSDG